MRRSSVLGLDVVRHPWRGGQLWAALVWVTVVALYVLRGHYLSLAELSVLAGLLVLGGLVFGAAMSVLALASGQNKDGLR